MLARSKACYTIHGEIASGGMASVHIGRIIGMSGFSRIVAIKRMHRELSSDPELKKMFLDEARTAGLVRHPSVVPVLDVLDAEGEILLVMEYVEGQALSRILDLCLSADSAIGRVPIAVAVAIASEMLHGLHAAHEATDDRGQWLGLVHRDVSPQNILVGADGLTRVADFGISKSAGRLQVTRQREIKGKLRYMAPEQLRRDDADRRTDVWGASVVLWELLTGRPLFAGRTDAETFGNVMHERIPRPSSIHEAVDQELDDIVLRGLDRFPERRYATAEAMAAALESAVRPATHAEVRSWLLAVAGDDLRARSEALRRSTEGAPTHTYPVDDPTSRSAMDRALATATPRPGGTLRRQVDAMRRRWFASMIAALALLIALVVMGALRKRSGVLASDPPSATPSATAASSIGALGADPVESAPAAPEMPGESTTSPDGTRSEPPDPNPSRAVAKKGAPAGPSHGRPAATSAATSEAMPPEGCRVRDDAGVWHIHPGCLRP